MYNVIGELLIRLRQEGAEEAGDESEAAAIIREAPQGEPIDIVLYLEDRPRPILIRALREGDNTVLALLDLDAVRFLPSNVLGDVQLTDLEDVTTRIGLERFGDLGFAPFMFPLAVTDDGVFVAMGIKTVVGHVLVTGGLLNEYIEKLYMDGDAYYSAIVEGLKKRS